MATVIATIGAAVSIPGPVAGWFRTVRGENSDEVQIVRLWLEPRPGGAQLPDFRDVAELHLRVRNEGKDPLQLTSMQVEPRDAGPVHLATGTVIGSGVLGSDLRQNAPIRIGPGDSADFAFREGVALPGVPEALDQMGLAKEWVSRFGKGFLLHNDTYVDSLARVLGSRAGNGAVLRVTLRTGHGRRIREFSVSLNPRTTGRDGVSLEANSYLAALAYRQGAPLLDTVPPVSVPSGLTRR